LINIPSPSARTLPKEILLQIELQKGAINRWTVIDLMDRLWNYVLACE